MEYYWISGIQEGHPFIGGWYSHDAAGYGRAQSDGIQFCGSNFEILTLHTRDVNAAKKEISFLKAKRGMPISETFQRCRRGKPELEASSAYKEIRTKEINGEL